MTREIANAVLLPINTRMAISDILGSGGFSATDALYHKFCNERVLVGNDALSFYRQTTERKKLVLGSSIENGSVKGNNENLRKLWSIGLNEMSKYYSIENMVVSRSAACVEPKERETWRSLLDTAGWDYNIESPKLVSDTDIVAKYTNMGTGIMVRLGVDSMTATAYLGGFPINGSISTTLVGSASIDSSLEFLMPSQDAQFDKLSAFDKKMCLREFKEQFCSVQLTPVDIQERIAVSPHGNASGHIRGHRTLSAEQYLDHNENMPTYKVQTSKGVITLKCDSNIRQQAPEVILNPAADCNNRYSNPDGLGDIVMKAYMQGGIEFTELVGNIVLHGGGAKMAGLKERLAADVQNILDTINRQKMAAGEKVLNYDVCVRVVEEPLHVGVAKLMKQEHDAQVTVEDHNMKAAVGENLQSAQT